MKQKDNTLILSAAVIVMLLVAGLGYFFVQQAQRFQVLADTAGTSAGITNAAPTVGTVALNGGSNITLDEYILSPADKTTTVSCTATIHDDNGCEDISSVTGKLYRTDATATGADSELFRYSTTCAQAGADTCTAGGSDLEEGYTCTFEVYYFADATDVGTHAATDWSCDITATDGTTPDTATSAGREMIGTAAIAVDGAIDYGSSRALGFASDAATNHEMTMTNTGNVSTDLIYSGTDMTCTIGTIPATAQKFDFASDVVYASMTNGLTTSGQTETGFDLAKATSSGTDSDTILYWGIQIPSSGVSGSCSGTNTLTAFSNET